MTSSGGRCCATARAHWISTGTAVWRASATAGRLRSASRGASSASCRPSRSAPTARSGSPGIAVSSFSDGRIEAASRPWTRERADGSWLKTLSDESGSVPSATGSGVGRGRPRGVHGQEQEWSTTRSRRCRWLTGRSGRYGRRPRSPVDPTAAGAPGRFATACPPNRDRAVREGEKGDIWVATRGASLAGARVGSAASPPPRDSSTTRSRPRARQRRLDLDGQQPRPISVRRWEIEELFAGRATASRRDPSGSKTACAASRSITPIEPQDLTAALVRHPRGAATLDPAHRRRNPLPPPVVIEEVVADGRTLQEGFWSLPAGTNGSTSHYTALSFASVPGTVRDIVSTGFDPGWVAARPTISYTSLKHGHYRFGSSPPTAMASGTGGATVEFEIAPQIHETAWFRALAVLLFAFAQPVLLSRAGAPPARLRQSELEQLVAERTAEVAAANVRLAMLAREDAT